MADLSKEPKVHGAEDLTPRQRRFVVEFLRDRNGTQAAIRAGFSEKGAAVSASKLLRHPKIATYLAARLAKLAKTEAKLDISAERTLLEIARLAYVDPAQFYDEKGHLKLIHDIPEDARRALHGMESFEEFEGAGADRTKVGDVRKVKWHDKRAALADLAKIQGLLKEKVEVGGPDGGPVIFRIEED